MEVSAWPFRVFLHGDLENPGDEDLLSPLESLGLSGKDADKSDREEPPCEFRVAEENREETE